MPGRGAFAIAAPRSPATAGRGVEVVRPDGAESIDESPYRLARPGCRSGLHERPVGNHTQRVDRYAELVSGDQTELARGGPAGEMVALGDDAARFAGDTASACPADRAWQRSHRLDGHSVRRVGGHGHPSSLGMGDLGRRCVVSACGGPLVTGECSTACAALVRQACVSSM